MSEVNQEINENTYTPQEDVLKETKIMTKEEYDKIIEKNELEINNHGQRSVIPIRTNV